MKRSEVLPEYLGIAEAIGIIEPSELTKMKDTFKDKFETASLYFLAWIGIILFFIEHPLSFIFRKNM